LKAIILPEALGHGKNPRREGIANVKLHLAGTEGRNTVTGYGAGYVTVSSVRYERSLVVLPDRLIENWGAGAAETLDEGSVAALVGLGAEIVLIGTGLTLKFPSPEILRPLIDARIGFEVMDTGAACRTYNVLVAENRRVAAAIVI
jgi:uncharacterized protein